MRFDFRRSSHPSGDVLLAWSEGELSWWRSFAVSRHVRACWQCRIKAKQWEEIACHVAAGLEEFAEPGKVETSKAWWRFQQACRDLAPARRRRSWRIGPAWVTAAASVIAAAGVAVLTIPNPFLQETNTPAPVLRPALKPKPQSPAFAVPAAPARPKPEAVPDATQINAALPSLETSAPSEEELLAAEVYAGFELHRARLCNLEVARAGSHVEVRGVMVSAEKHDRLMTLFQAPEFNGLIKLNLVEHGGQKPEPHLRLFVSPAQSPASSPLEASLRERFGGRTTQREIFHLMGEIVLEAETVSEHAWALHRLAGQFPASRTRVLRPELQDLLLRMAADHANAIAAVSSTLWRRMSPDADLIPDPEFLASDPGGRNQSWQDRALQLHGLAESAAGSLLLSVNPNAANTPPPRELFQRCASTARSLHSSLQTQLARLP